MFTYPGQLQTVSAPYPTWLPLLWPPPCRYRPNPLTFAAVEGSTFPHNHLSQVPFTSHTPLGSELARLFRVQNAGPRAYSHWQPESWNGSSMSKWVQGGGGAWKEWVLGPFIGGHVGRSHSPSLRAFRGSDSPSRVETHTERNVGAFLGLFGQNTIR